MIKLGKKNDEILETIEAFGCNDIIYCDECADGNRASYKSNNDNDYWIQFRR